MGRVAVRAIPVMNRWVAWGGNRTLREQSTLGGLRVEDRTRFTLMFGFLVFGLVAWWLLIHRFRVGWLEQAAIDHDVATALAERRSETSATDRDAAGGRRNDGEDPV